jgi:hypothetical protein
VTGFTAGAQYVIGADFADESGEGGTFTSGVTGTATGGDVIGQSFTLNDQSTPDGNPIDFQSGFVVFTATADGSATFSFSSPGTTALDNVALYGGSATAPEPSTYAEMLLGLGALVVLARRKAVRAQASRA